METRKNYDQVFILYWSFTIFSLLSSQQDSTKRPKTKKKNKDQIK